MQNPVVMAFRKRLKNRGYTSISICKAVDRDCFIVTGCEPLANMTVSCFLTLSEMYRLFR